MPATVVYDGYCNLCSASVRFLDRWQRPGALAFVANPEPDQQTVTVIDGGREYTYSDASLQALKHLRWPWPLLRVALVVPKPLRDRVYRWVAASRYRWFGRSESCAVAPTGVRRP